MDSRGAGLIRPSVPVSQRTNERDITRRGGDKSNSSDKTAHSDPRAVGRCLGSRLVRRRSFDDATNLAVTRETCSLASTEKVDTASDQAAAWISVKSRASVPLRARANSGPPLDSHKRGSCLYQKSRSMATKPTEVLLGHEDRQCTSASSLGPKATRMDDGEVARGVPSAEEKDVRESETTGYKPGAGDGDGLKGKANLLRPLAGRCWFQDCGKVTVYRCRRCREAFYCSKDHQRRHWGKHRSKCKEGVGEPTPTLAYRTLPISSSVPPLRQQAKVVGWADSAPYSRGRTAADGTCQSMDGGRVPPGVGGVWLGERQPLWHSTTPATAAIAATGAILRPGTNQESLGQSSSSGDVDANTIPGAVDGVSTNLENREPSTALRGEGPHGFDSSVRSTRGGTTWTVLSSGRGAGGLGGGSAEVWPSSTTSSTGGSIGGSGRSVSVANIAEEAAAVARRRVSGASFGRAMGSGSANDGLGVSRQMNGGKQQDASSSPPRYSPSLIPTSCLPPNLEPLIPLPSGRPLDDGAEVTSTSPFDDGLKMLTDMGFEHEKARRALRLCDQDVERAAELLLTPDDDLAVCGVGIGIPDGGDTNEGGEVIYGPHRKPPDDDDGKFGWGGGTELEVVSTNDTGGKHSGKRDDDDLITNADPGDVAQGLDLGDFWECDRVSEGGGASSGTTLAAQCTIASQAANDWERSVDFGKRDHEEEGRAKMEDEDNRDLVTSYEDCVAGANADVLMYYQSSDDTRLSTITTTTATTATGTAVSATPDPDMATAAIQAPTSVVTERTEATDLDILPLAFAQPGSLESPSDTTAELPTVTATTVAGNCLSEGDAVSAGGEAVLTIILRPLPSTAPASLDSDSCTGEGTDDRYDPPHDTEHLAVLSWRDAEALAWRYQQIQAKKATVKATPSESSAPGGATNARGGRLFIDPSALPLPQSPPPLSPLSPPSCARQPSTAGEQSTACSSIDWTIDGASPPTWRRKHKVGRMIVSMFRRSTDGGFEIVAPEDMETLDGIGRKANPVGRTRERPRGRSSAKLARYGVHACGDKLPLHEQPVPPSSFKWGADVKELTQAWSCPACTFLNTDPAFRTACEICREERPHVPLLSSDDPTVWGLTSRDPGGVELQVGATMEGVDDTGGTTSNAFFPASDVGGDARAPGAAMKASALLEPVAVGGVHGASAASHHRGADQQDEDDDVVDGILGGVSPGGIASPPAPEPTLNESEWEAGAEWGGFGGASFVESPVDLSPLRSRFNLRYQDVRPNQANGNGAEDNQCASTSGGGNARPP